MRINSVPDVKSFCNNKNVLCAQSMVRHFVRHPILIVVFDYIYRNLCSLQSSYYIDWAIPASLSIIQVLKHIFMSRCSSSSAVLLLLSYNARGRKLGSE